ncbi:response regulator transcription factor, partial [Pseudonocardia sp.]|uniref:response regulator n=1 Tax=Pseudonocardia sp. TaxID=60912 RepID=UPI0031FBC6FF
MPETAILYTTGHPAPPLSAPGRQDHPTTGATTMIRLMVVDDHAIVRRGLVRVVETAPDIELVGTAANGIEALHLLTRSRPDVVLMDIGMPVLDGVGATRLIVDHDPQVRVVVLTGSA